LRVTSFSCKIQNGSIVTPRTSWLTQLGAVTKSFLGADQSQNDTCFAVETDGNGNVYCAGSTAGSIGEANGGVNSDVFVAKIKSDGTLEI
jgi:isoaspartyl peptidase/L-asparaginase-like protein (Ntn-hydrolase superfamily)